MTTLEVGELTHPCRKCILLTEMFLSATNLQIA